MHRNGRFVLLAVAAVVTLAGTTHGQGYAVPRAQVPEPAVKLTEDEARALSQSDLTPEQREKLRIWNKTRVESEKQMKTIRFKYFGTKAVKEIRQAGVAELRKVTEPAAFPSMLEIFRDEQPDVLKAVCDHLADLKTDQSLTTLSYAAIYEKKPEFRKLAADALKSVIDTTHTTPDGVHTVIASGLDSQSYAWRGDAARLAVSLKLVEAIPAMIAAQLSGAGGGGAGGYIAWIAIGTQHAYVADLDPVVGNGSVAFDPVPGVVTDGCVLAINDAVVVQYNVGVHDALVGFTSGLSGEDTSRLGWNPRKWQAWYAGTLVPKLNQPKADPKTTKPGNPTAGNNPPETLAQPKRRSPSIAV